MKMCFLNLGMDELPLSRYAETAAQTRRAALDTPHDAFRMVTMDATLNGRLAMINLPDSDGNELRLGSLWLRQPAVLVFLRHYG